MPNILFPKTFERSSFGTLFGPVLSRYRPCNGSDLVPKMKNSQNRCFEHPIVQIPPANEKKSGTIFFRQKVTKNSKDPLKLPPFGALFGNYSARGAKKTKTSSGTLGSHILDTFWTLTGLASAHSGSPKVDSPKLPTADSQTAHSGFPNCPQRVPSNTRPCG